MPQSIQYLTFAQISAYAEEKNLSLHDAVASLMVEGLLPEQFRRNSGLLSLPLQQKLFELPIFLAGCGGLGGELAAHLAQLGAANLHLCDFDAFEESNLNRQRFCSHAVLGQKKAVVTAHALKDKAPWGTFQAIDQKLDADTLPGLISPSAIVIDCLDSVSGKTLLEEACANTGKAWLHGSILHHEGFAFLTPNPGGHLQKLYGPHCAQSGAGSTLSHVVAGTATLMAALFVKWLANPAFSSKLLHADFSIPEVEAFSPA